MCLSRKALIAASVFLFISASIAQQPYRLSDPAVIARLSYGEFGLVAPAKPAHVCFAVSRNRDYWIERLQQNEQTKRLKGTLSEDQFNTLDQLLSARQFRDLGGNHGAPVIRQYVEIFGAEIPLDDASWRLRWMNGDGENPFPESVSKIVDWLQSFQAARGQSFEHMEYPGICPAPPHEAQDSGIDWRGDWL